MSNTPKLRFKEFSGEWESKKLGDLGDVTKLAGFEFTKHVEYSDTGEIIALRGLNVKNGKLILDDVKYIDNSDFSKLNRSKLFVDDLLFTYVGTVGETALINQNDKYYLAPNVSRIRFNLDESNSKFMHYNISRSEYFNKVIKPSIATSSQPALSMENIRKLDISIPSKEEQEKIASFFSLIDDKISLQGEKVDALKDYKKGMMQKIFSRELRFKDDDGRDYPEWEEKKLGDIASVCTGNKDTQDKVENGIYPFFVRSQMIERINSYSYDGEAILTAGDGVGVGKVFHYINGKFDYHQRVYKISDFSENTYGRYLYEYFRVNFIREVTKYTAKTSVDSVRMEMITKMKIPYPILDEQIKIANILKNIDLKIDKEQEKLYALNEYKKGLLQQLFI